MNRAFNTALVGDIVNFAGKQWIVLDPATSYVMEVGFEDARPFDSAAASYFDPTKSSNIGNWLNTTFYNGLPNKEYIQNTVWTLRPEMVDSEGVVHQFTVTANFALPTADDWANIKHYFGWMSQKAFWTFSPDTNFEFNKLIGTNGGGYPVAANSTGVYVRPVLHFKQGLYLTPGGDVTDSAGTVGSAEIANGSIGSQHLSDIVKMNQSPVFTVVQGQSFNLVVAGSEDLADGLSSGGVTVRNGDIGDGYIQLSGVLPTNGIQVLKLGGYSFVFQVIPAPNTSTVTATFN
ncbi:hypothetical protein [Paenibacillus andongensis]|uniref:hypothetical protein n=1 Tax=Paenibacillus andongensis TaxID=2975482 RepID=UPI0021BA494F|nr:hypothetical protein [Paenibacillus andongensis]